jgi:HAD superfamily hydrolase (TIGR01549 family)
MPLDVSRVRALCFDIDGTLNDTDDQYLARVAGWLTPFRFIFRDRNPNRFARRLIMAAEAPGSFLMGLPDRLGIDGPLTALGDRFYQMRQKKASQSFLLIPGILEMLQCLESRYPMAIVSARAERITELFLDQFNLRHFFVWVAHSQTCEHTKPYPDPILWAAQKMNVAPTDCLMIGDTKADILAGKAAQAQTIGVLCGFGDEKELRQAGADLILESTAKLADLLLNH